VRALAGVFALVLSVGVGATVARAASEDAVDFRTEVQPILIRHCYKCHGPEKRKGDLRLTNRRDAFTPAESGIPVIVPGASEASILIDLVSSSDPEERMPKKKAPLDEREIGVLRTWIDQGAPWPDDAEPLPRHWAYLPPRRPELPDVKDRGWPRNPIDFFILERLEKSGLRPAPPADKATLLRRVSLDLTGLPPTPAELDAFVADDSPDAYDAVVDRLLASPHFGEAWARSWLDQARYADSNGYTSDDIREAWLYRDWVINAINTDMPFDQFTVEQLAGDMLPNPTAAQRIATGFNRNTMLSLEAGVNYEEARLEQITNRVNTTATVWLASTLECAQCHNHKYDPFSHEDYYRFFAFFNNTPMEGEVHDELPRYRYGGPQLELGLQPALEPYLARLKMVQQESLRYEPTAAQLEERKRRLEETVRHEIQWTTLAVESFTALGGERGEPLPDGSLLISGPVPAQSTYTLRLRTDVGRITGIRIEALKDPSLPANGPGRGSEGGFVLNEVELRSAGAKDRELISLRDPVAPLQADSVYRLAVDGDPVSGWDVAAGPEQGTAIVLELTNPLERDSESTDTPLEIVLHQNAGRSLSIGRLRISATADDPAVIGLNQSTKDLFLASKRAEGEERWLDGIARLLTKDPARMQETRRTHQKVEQIRKGRIFVMSEMATPRTTHVFLRGNHLTPGKEVSPGTPTALPTMDEKLPRNRLGLARWIVDPANPLTARVAVNRWWAELFGRGIVFSLEDFGKQADPPTHPELLDWLATDLVASGWSRKHIVRLLVTSAAYRQSSDPGGAGAASDPLNTLLWHNPRLRLPAETIRDQALAAAGLLSDYVGGPPVYPPQPDGLWNHEGGVVEPPYWTDQDADRFRRGVYVVWRRVFPYPPFSIFDAPDRSICSVSRSRTATPLQALVLLNDEGFVEAALGLTNRVLKDRTDEDEMRRLQYAFRLVMVREPTDAELRVLGAFLDREIQRFATDPAAAREALDSIHPRVPRPDGLPPGEVAAWLQVARVILNLDEAVTRG
jgi:hypothetical protein